MTIAGLSIASMGYSMEAKVTKPESGPAERVQNPVENSLNDAEKSQAEERNHVQNQQRSELSYPWQAISEYSKNKLGIPEQGILVSSKISLYDQELANIRNNPSLKSNFIRSTIGTEEYSYPKPPQRVTIKKGEQKDQEILAYEDFQNKAKIEGSNEFYSLHGVKIAVNAITGTIKWIDNNGKIIKMLKKNLNGTTTETTNNGKLQTTYATANRLGKRTEKASWLKGKLYITNYDTSGLITTSQSVDENIPAFSTLIQTNYDENNISIKKMAPYGGDNNITSPDYNQAFKEALSEQTTSLIGGISNSLKQLTIPTKDLRFNSN